MAIKSISDLYNFSLFIFDLDNTIYNEEDYLFQAYRSIAERFSVILPGFSKDKLHAMIKNIYLEEGRDKLFDKFLNITGLDKKYIPECLEILRTFTPEMPFSIFDEVSQVLSGLRKRNKKVYVLTNGNADQQRNKIRNISWEGLDKDIEFVFANETEPKPSPMAVYSILEKTGASKDQTIFIGDSERDWLCARNSGITFFNAEDLYRLVHNSQKTGKSIL